MNLKSELDRMQMVLGAEPINAVLQNWKLFYAVDEKRDCVTGFCFLYRYTVRSMHAGDSGKRAELDMFTFPEYRHQGVCRSLLHKALDFAQKNNIGLVTSDKCQIELLSNLTKRELELVSGVIYVK